MTFHLRLARAEIARLDKEAEQSWEGPWSHHPAEVVLQWLDGVWPPDLEWMLLAAVVKDAVTAYEVYLEKGAREVVGRHRLAFEGGDERSLRWRDLVDFYRDHLGLEVASADVRRIRKMRHILTHDRGSLRTEELRQEFGQQVLIDEVYLARQIALTDESVAEACDALADAVRKIDPAVWEAAWNGKWSPSLQKAREQLDANRTAEGSATQLGPEPPGLAEPP